MADTTYFASPSRRELRERRLVRQESRKAQCQVFSALESLKSAGGVYEEPAVSLITAIPPEMLPKKKNSPFNPTSITSLVKSSTENPAYEADLKSRPKSADHSAKPIVFAERPLPMKWEITHQGKNDTTTVQSKLGYTHGKGEAPPIYAPGAENPRKEVEAKRKDLVNKFVQPSAKKPEEFEYKPKVTKLPKGEQPRVVSLVPPPAALPPPKSAGLQGKPFK
jgi:hypothetical protein